jgi:hypothetical protein
MYHVLLAILVVMLGTGRAHAQPLAGEDQATADALFIEGRRLSAERRFAEACAQFEASMALSQRLGVALNLADCYEHLGKTASAWVAFGAAAALARRLADPREAFALQRQEALVPRLSRLRITPSGAPLDGVAVVRDGVRVDPAAYGVAVPVDPGTHVVDATAPGRTPWSTRIAVSREGEITAVEIPELERMSAPPAAPLVTPAGATVARPSIGAASAVDPGGRRTTPVMWIALGVSATGIGAGTAFGFAARSLWQQARPDCDAFNHCSDAASALIARSHRDGDLSTAAFAVAGAALITGAVLYLHASRARPARVVPALAADAVSVEVAAAGTW